MAGSRSLRDTDHGQECRTNLDSFRTDLKLHINAAGRAQ